MRSPSRASIPHLVVSALFIVGCFTPLLASLFGVSGGEMRENRRLTERPRLELSIGGLGEFPAAFDRYFGDSFGLRGTFVAAHAWLRYRLFSLSSTDRVVIGRDGWLFTTLQKSLEDHRGQIPFTPGDLRNWQGIIEERAAWAAEHDARYVFVLSPSKHTLFAEHLPAGYTRLGPSRREQFLEHMREHSTVPVLDLAEPLRDARAPYPLYYRSDSHWTEPGALVAAGTIVERLSELLPPIPPLGLADFEISEVPATVGGDLAHMVGLPEEFAEPTYRLAPREPCAIATAAVLPDPADGVPEFPGRAWECARPELPKLLLYGDSFAIALAPLLAERFSRTVYVRTYGIEPAFAALEQPDVIVDQMNERFLFGGRANPPEVTGALERARQNTRAPIAAPAAP